ncbi:MAG: protein translocase subunit SecD [Akkermansiaceae bacterium]|jgi:SecD/SecF fusion protein
MLAVTFFNDPLIIFLIGLSLLGLFFWYFATEIETRKRNIGTILLVGIVALCSFAIYPPDKNLKMGIDIGGGSAFTVRIQQKLNGNGDPMPITKDQVNEAIRVIESRLDPDGKKDLLAVQQGEDSIIVQMPGIKPEESAEIRDILETVAKLELKEVSPRNNEIGANGKSLAQRVFDGEEVDPGYKAYMLTSKDSEGNEFTNPILLKRISALGGSDVEFASPSMSQNNAVDVTLNGKGADKMFNLTKDMRLGQDRIAILLDDVVICAPTVNAILSKNFEISGLDDVGEPKKVTNALMNPLENPLIVDEERTVSPTLGAAIVTQGIWSALLGLAITAIFVLIYYRTAGIVALVGLAVNGIMLFGAMAMFGFAFSLPGIAGIILTIGLAVDANVLIYERLREELQNGKSLKSALAASYDKAFSAIFDANITSLISAVILFAMSSGSIKGFAVTLTIGIVASMFSAILVTRILFRWGTDLNLLNKLSFLDLIKATNFDFISAAKKTAIVSSIVIIVSLSGFGIRGDKALGIDFTGGTRIQFQLGDKDIKLNDVDSVLSTLTLTRSAFPQIESNPATGSLLTLRTDKQDAERIVSALRSGIPALGEMEDGSYIVSESREDVSATLGKGFLVESLIALALGLVGIGIYITIRFEFSFAVGAFTALVHDVIIAVGVVVLLGRELSLIHVGAILTIAGYSINDTIVIFDRIRETILLRSGAIKDVINEAINATLSRTILTSATTIVTVAILSLFGGSSLRDFSIMILIGLVVGTYSSVFIASPIVLWWSQRKGGNLRKDVLATTLAAQSADAAKAE